MAIYCYKCTECSHQFEESRPICYRNQCPACPNCGKETERQIEKTSFLLEGGGWAKDGYSKISNKKSS